MLFVSAEDHWHCQVSDGTFRSATAGAKKLAQVMEKKFSVSDLTKLIGEWL
jgi:hypothetical protein